MAHDAARQLSLITGASSGIGLELAREFARHGHDLVICSNDAPQLGRAADSLRGEFPEAAVTSIEVDLREREAVEDLWRQCLALGRPVDVLVANAGVGVAGRFDETDLDEELDIIDLNVKSQVHLIKLALRKMKEQGHGKLLITSSLIALSPGPFMATYAATKAFLHSFGLAIRNELQDLPIVVTVLMPGATETDFWKRADMEDTNIGRKRKDDPESVAKEAFAALEKEAAYIVPGYANKVRAGLTAITPDTGLAQANRGQAQKP